MAYIETFKAAAGKEVIEVRKFYSGKALPEDRRRREARARREKQSSDQQRATNKRILCRALAMNIKNNFGMGDFYLTLTFRKGVTAAERMRAYGAFVKRMQRLYRRNGKEFLYIAAVGGRCRDHIHILINRAAGIGLGEVKNLWEKKQGHVFYKIFAGWFEDCVRLAAYLRRNAEQSGGRVRVSNTIVPCEQHRRRVSRSECFSQRIKTPKGYHVNKELTRQEYTCAGYPCQYIIFERDGT